MDKVTPNSSFNVCPGCDMCLRLLDVLNSSWESKDIARGVVNVMKGSTGFEAVGLRLLQSDDFPFYCSEGMVDDFIASENLLIHRGDDGEMILDSLSMPAYECLCGMVLSGRKTSDSCFTSLGSFWTNDLPLLKGIESCLPAINVRHKCNRAGYRSLAILPIKVNGRIIGLLYMSDKRPNLLNAEMVGFLERAASAAGAAFARLKQNDLIQENLNFTAMLMEVLPIPIFYKGRDGRYLGCNTAFEKLTGLDKADVIGKTVFEVAPKDIADVYYQRDMELFESRSVQMYEAALKRPDGALRHVVFYKAVYNSADGAVAGLIGSILDVTDAKDRVGALQTFHKFAREIVHEINNILLVAKGNSQFMLGQGEDYRDWKQDAEAIFESMGRAEELVKKIRAFNEQTAKSMTKQSD